MEMMKAIQVAAKGEPMELVEIPVPQPGEGQVLLKVEACGICHGDSKVIEGAASSYRCFPINDNSVCVMFNKRISISVIFSSVQGGIAAEDVSSDSFSGKSPSISNITEMTSSTENSISRAINGYVCKSERISFLFVCSSRYQYKKRVLYFSRPHLCRA